MCDATGRAVEAAVHSREALAPGDVVNGPALIQEAQTTTLVSAGWRCIADAALNLHLERTTP